MQNRIRALLSRQEVRYILVGITQLVLDWTLFVLLTAWGVPIVIANTFGRILIAILGFCLHGRYTFGDPEAAKLGWGRFVRFACVWVSLAACSTITMYLVGAAWGLSIAWIIKPFVELILAGVSYLLLRHWVYR